MIKAGLQLNIGQQLTISPQLQQAIKMLQWSAIELEQQIQEKIESNPLLEREEELPTDQSYTAFDLQYNNFSNVDHTGQEFANIASPKDNLHDHLLWQVYLNFSNEEDKIIAQAIIDNIDEHGYLITSLSEIQQDAKLINIPMGKIENILKTLQQLDPFGVCSRNVQEYLLLQLAQKKENTETTYYNLLFNLITHHLDNLSKKQYKTIKKSLNIDNDTLLTLMTFIRRLNPRPASNISNKQIEYIIPDLIIYKEHNLWQIRLNENLYGNLRINKKYASILTTGKQTEDHGFIKQQLSEAKWFLKSLQNRHDTLLKVAKYIFKQQQDFLTIGETAIKPLILQEVAQNVNLHESTISRITNKKYIYTPRGIYELKYFFSSSICNSENTDYSATAIKAHIKFFIKNESNQHPLSDEDICKRLKDMGINIARRTVTKYRKSLQIPSSSQRKELA